MHMRRRDIVTGIILIILLALSVGTVSALTLTVGLTADINPGGSSSPKDLILYGGNMYFTADDGTNGRELWVYDGTNPPSMVANINPAGSADPGDLVVYNGNLYFRANDGVNGNKLWMYDGVNPPAMVLGGANNSFPAEMTVYSGKLYFSSYHYPEGIELMVYDDGPNTITVAANINTTPAPLPAVPPEDSDSNPFSLAVYNGNLYFQADDGVVGAELWMFDGTTATLADDINGAGSSAPEGMIAYGGDLYFSADGGSDGVELWRYNSGTGTSVQVLDIFSGPDSSYPIDFIIYNGDLFFTARDSVLNYEWWSTDGTTTALTIDFEPGADGSDPGWPVVFMGNLYFTAYHWPEGYEFIVYDGTSASVAANINPNTTPPTGASFGYPLVWGDRLYFRANNGSVGEELFEYSDRVWPVVIRHYPNALTEGPVFSIRVIYSEEVYDPIGNADPDDVTNPANYRLVEYGLNGIRETDACAAALGGDDVEIAVNSVTYDNPNREATVYINNGPRLPLGKYALIVCTSIIDLGGNPLNNGVEDSILPFEVVDELPDTGFAPGVVTTVSGTNNLAPYSSLWLEIPELGVQVDILGVPKTGEGWNVDWLGGNAGWLQGSAFPTLEGNTVLTGHVWAANGYPGPFQHIKQLQHGDTVKIHAWGLVYTYEVRQSRLVLPSQSERVFQHEEYDWVTLMTCENWDATAHSYDYRRIVRAVLVDISPE